MRKARSRRGIAATELAVVLPLFVILGIVPLELCNLIHLKQSVSVAAYEAAKTATRPVSSDAKMMAVFDRVIADREIQGATISASQNIDTMQPGDTIAVTVEAPFAENSFFNVWFLTTSPTSTVTMIKE
jgi:Flp pilus assembly protein TadG